MAERRRSSTSKILTIERDTPHSYIYTNGEIISGRVLLRSPHDEDVQSIILQLTGIGSSHVSLAGRNTTSISLPDQWEGLVFLNMHQELYQGNYKIFKNFTYEWPFKMRFPNNSSLLPSGSHGRHQMMSNGQTEVNYELKVSRATSAEQARALTKIAIDGQGAGIGPKLRGLTASFATMSLNFLPSRPIYIAPDFIPTRETWALHSHQTNDQQPSSNKFSLKSLFKSSPRIDYTVRVDLPKNFVQDEHLPSFIRIIPKASDVSNPGPVTVEKVEYVLSMRVRHKASGYVGENLHQLTILKIDHPGIVINDSGKYDIGGQYRTNVPMWPTFNSDIVETRHNLRAHIELNASGKKFNDIFTLTNCNVYPTRVTPSPLNKDYICSFYANGEDDDIIRNSVIEAFFAVSSALTEKRIYPQIVTAPDPSAVLALLLPEQHHGQTKPNPLVSEGTTPLGSLEIPDPGLEDQRWLSSILKDTPALQGTTSHFLDQGGFAYRYPDEKSSIQVRLEFSDPALAASLAPPPSYPKDTTTSTSTSTSTHPHQSTLTLPTLLNHLLTTLSTTSPSPPPSPNPPATNAPPPPPPPPPPQQQQQHLANAEHLCQNYSAQLRPLVSALSVPDAQRAVAKHPALRNLLVRVVGMDSRALGAEEEEEEDDNDDEPRPRVLTREEAKWEKRREMANKVGYWSPAAQKREQIYGSN